MKINNDKIAGKLSDYLLKIQTRFAASAANAVARCSNRSLKIAFAVLLLLFLSLSTWLLIDAFGEKCILQKVTIMHMRLPRTSNHHDVAKIILTLREYNGLQRLHHYMDSLRLNKSGKALYDSIIKARPGLMDSVTVLENIYLSQKK